MESPCYRGVALGHTCRARARARGAAVDQETRNHNITYVGAILCLFNDHISANVQQIIEAD